MTVGAGHQAGVGRLAAAYTLRSVSPVLTRFLDCELDAAARQLRKAGVAVHLTPKALEVLLLLVARRPAAVTKDELLQLVWSDTFVSDASLARTVHEIRGAIGDTSAEAIRTVHGHGYAFQASVSELGRGEPQRTHTLNQPVRGWLFIGGRALALHDGTLLVGRDPRADVPVDSRHASWHHARIVVAAGQVVIADMDSKNGTFVRGIRLVGAQALEDDDDIVVGAVRLVYRTGFRRSPTDTDPAE